MSCLDCEHVSVSKEYCPLATSFHHRPMKIEDPNKVPEWCPLLNNKTKENR